MSFKGTVFLPHFGNFRGRRGGSDTLFGKIVHVHVTKINKIMSSTGINTLQRQHSKQ